MEMKSDPSVKKKDAYEFESSDSETEIPLKRVSLSSKKLHLKPLPCHSPTQSSRASTPKSASRPTTPKQGSRPSTPKGKSLSSKSDNDQDKAMVNDTGQNNKNSSEKKAVKPRERKAAKPKHIPDKDGDAKSTRGGKAPARPRDKKPAKETGGVKKAKKADINAKSKEDYEQVDDNSKTEVTTNGVENVTDITTKPKKSSAKQKAETENKTQVNGSVCDENDIISEKPQPKKRVYNKKKPLKSTTDPTNSEQGSDQLNENQKSGTFFKNHENVDKSLSVNVNNRDVEQSDSQDKHSDQKSDPVSKGNTPKKKSPKTHTSPNKKTSPAQKNKSVNKNTVKKDSLANTETASDVNISSESKAKFNFQCENCDYSAKRKSDLTKHSKKCSGKSQKDLNKETITGSSDQVTAPSDQVIVNNDHALTTNTQTPSLSDQASSSSDQQPGNKVIENASDNKNIKTASDNKVIESKSLDEKAPDNQLPYHCVQCSYCAENEEDLNKHSEKCESDKPELYHCTQCNYKVKKRVLLLRHQYSHGIFACPRCDFMGNDKEHLDSHSRQEHSQRIGMKFCKLCSRYIKNRVNFDEHTSKCQGRQPLLCNKCNREFKFESHLKMHLMTHAPAEEKKFRCDMCEYRTNYKANLAKHQAKHDENRERDIKCPDCDMMFFTNDKLSKHQQTQHSSARPYQCEECRKTYKTKQALHRHKAVHSNAKAFKCEVEGCDKQYKVKNALKVHHAEVHEQQPKKFACEFDGCNHIFPKQSHLRRHQTAHTGERKYKCTWPGCDKSFRYSDNLRVHLRRHTDEKPIKCELCEFSCRQKSSLQWHLKKYHQQEKQASPSEKTKPARQKKTKTPTKKNKSNQKESDKIDNNEGEKVKTEEKSEEEKKDSTSPTEEGASKQKTKKTRKPKKKKSEGKSAQEDPGEKHEADDTKDKDSAKTSKKSKRKRKSDNVDAEKEHAKDSPKKKRKTKKKNKVDADVSEKSKLPPKKRRVSHASSKKSKKSSKNKNSLAKEEKKEEIDEEKEREVTTEEDKIQTDQDNLDVKPEEQVAAIEKSDDQQVNSDDQQMNSDDQQVNPDDQQVNSDDQQVNDEAEKMDTAVNGDAGTSEVIAKCDDITDISGETEEGVTSEVTEDTHDKPVTENMEENAENNQSEMSSDDDMDNGLSAIDPYESPVGAPRPPQRPESPESSEPSPFFSTGSLDDSDMKGMDAITEDAAAENIGADPGEHKEGSEVCSQGQQHVNSLSESYEQAERDSYCINEASNNMNHDVYADQVTFGNHGNNIESVVSNTVPVITTRSPMHQPPPPPPLTMPQTTMSSPMSSPQNCSRTDMPHQIASPASYPAPSPRETSAITSPGYCVSSPLNHNLPSTMASSVKSPGYPLPSPRDIPTSYASMGHVTSPATHEAPEHAQQGLYHAPSPANRDAAASMMMSPAGSQPPQSPYTNVSHVPSMTSQGLYPVPSPQVYRAPSPVKDTSVDNHQKDLISSATEKRDVMTSGPSMLNTPSPVRQAYAGISPSPVRTSQADSGSLGSELNAPEVDLIGRYMQSYVDGAPSAPTEPRFEPGPDPMQSYLLNKDLSREQFCMPGISSSLPTRFPMECDPRYSTDRNACIVGSGAFTYPRQNSTALDVTDRTKGWVSTPYMTKPPSIDTMSSPLFSNPVNSSISKDSYVGKDQFMSKDSLIAEAAAASMRDYMVRSTPTFPTTQAELTTDSYARYDPSRAWAAARHYSPHKPGMSGLDAHTHSQTMPNSVKHFPDPYAHQMAPQLPPSHTPDYRTLAQSASPEMFSRVNPAGLNPPPIPNLPYDKFFYPRDPALYRTQAIGSSLGATSNTFLPMNSGAAAATLSSRDYSRNPLYPPQPAINPYNPFMGDKQYMNAAGKLGQPLPGLAHPGERSQFYPGAPGPPTHPDPQGQDPYRRSVIYNMMNRYFE